MAFASKCRRMFSIIPRLSSQAKIASFSNGFLNSALKNYKAPDKKFWMKYWMVPAFGSLATGVVCVTEAEQQNQPEVIKITDEEKIITLIKEAKIANKKGNCAIARMYFEKALNIVKKHEKSDDDDEWDEQKLLQARIHVYDGIAVMGNLTEAEILYKSAIKKLVESKEADCLDCYFMELSLKLCQIFARQKRLKDAETCYTCAITTQQNRINNGAEADDKKQTSLNCKLSLCHNSYSNFLMQKCRLPEARTEKEKAAEALKRSCCRDNQSIAILLFEAAKIGLQQGEKDYAMEKIREAISFSERSEYYCSLGKLLYCKGDMEEAKCMCIKAVHLAREERDQNAACEAWACIDEVNIAAPPPFVPPECEGRQ